MATPTPAEVGARRREPLYKFEIGRLTLFDNHSTSTSPVRGDADVRTRLWRQVTAQISDRRQMVPNRVTIGYPTALALYRLGALQPSHFSEAREQRSTTGSSILLRGWSVYGQPLELLIVDDEKQPVSVSYEKPVT